MSQQSFYFINHSRKEFTFFSNQVSICKSLSEALHNNIGWTETDDIRVGSENYNETTCLQYIDDLKYTLSKLINKNN